ncbi:MAG: hypothetical protein A2015_07665 [Spirochaetes bacterium GWF1_31_7]|nr:MAG: hypothetical protein A2Y30_01760 [Spirochaetes bacterium GWE1_32_154]OHD46918.1 MAG: hypothetical protein A2015_07665 [Spirochaetes bacterium GWF1_31_7]OHD48696.1 MAG: hypothetical protein A2Y29_13895 [Spirochaetes bacterium GWE2_31_10]HBD94925.1 hypothetical protein [Spirochaetia bacterium]HBI36914.1 hypothetical protein [Spirochaetia bacterium]
MENSQLLGKIGIDENDSQGIKEPIFITLSEFKNYKYLDIRKHYNDNGEWKPTKKGVTMNISQIDDLFEIVKNNREIIENWFKK